MSVFTMRNYLKGMKDNAETFELRSQSFRKEVVEYLNETKLIQDYVKADNNTDLKLTFTGVNLNLESRERVVFSGVDSFLEFEFFTIKGSSEVSVLKVFFDSHGHIILGSHTSELKYDFVNDSIGLALFEALIQSGYDKGLISV